MPKLEPSNCGVLIRVYAKDSDKVYEAVERTTMSVGRATSAGLRPVVLIPLDKDCGETAGLLRERLVDEGYTNTILIAEHGNENTDLLNVGVEKLRQHGLSHVFIVSNKASHLLTPGNIWPLLATFDAGALNAGLAMEELRESVLEGRITNTFSVWDIEALQQAGGFVSPKGVEEIIPQIRLIRSHGPCLAPIMPDGESDLSLRSGAAAKDYHKEIVDTKWERQLEEAVSVHGSLDELWWGIHQNYLNSVAMERRCATKHA